MCQIPCDVSDAKDTAIISVNAQTKKHVQNVLIRVQTMTVLHVQIPFIASTARLHTLPFLESVLHGEKKKKYYQFKYNNNVSFPDARKLFEQRKKTSSGPSYAGVVGSSSEKDDCSTCKILAKILLQKFPDVAPELKELLPASTLSKLIPDSSSASKTNKPSSAQSKPTNPQSTSSQKTSKPSTSSQNIPPQKTSKPSPSSQQKPQTSSSVFY